MPADSMVTGGVKLFAGKSLLVNGKLSEIEKREG
jgi:hypothetical protein